MNDKIIKIVAIICSMIVIADFLLLIFKRITPIGFWFIIILCALVAYVGIPRLKRQ